MKKILAFLIMFVLMATAASAVTINKEAENSANIEFDEIKDCDCETNFEAGYPVIDFPPMDDRQLSTVDLDPQPTMSFDQLPSQFSWKNYGGDWTTGARDQQSCGSCWDFSALAAMEASINIASGNPGTDIDLSEQYVLSCLGGAGSCSGGWMNEALEYILSESPGAYGNGINGCPIESCMPYQAVDYIPCDNKCDDWDTYSQPPEYGDKLFQLSTTGWTTTSEDNPGDWNLMKSWLMSYGPLSVDILATGFGSWGNSNHGSTDVYQNDNNGVTNHGVLLVGWVDDDQIVNGGYWIIKNSWGAGWGYGGFGNIAYGCNGVATRNCCYCLSPAWPQSGGGGGGPIDVDAAVFSNFEYNTEDDNQCPHLGEEVEFYDTSDGDVARREWDFNGDGVVDSTKQRPTWTYYQEGDYEVKLWVTSAWGLESERIRNVGVYEVWPPVAKIKPDIYPDPQHPKNDLEVQFDARYSYDPDGGQIVSYLWDFDDGTTSNEVSPSHVFPEPDRIYEVTLTLTDNDGGVGSATRDIKIDQTKPPETTIIHGFGGNGDQWYSDTERISFSATDWSKVLFTYYSVDGSDWTRYIPEEIKYIPIGSEGMHTVKAYSIDYFHNEETPVVETFGIDKTLPSIDVTLTGEKVGDQYIEPVTVSLTGEDSLSGVELIKYKTLYEWRDYTGPFVVSEQCYLIYWIRDNAGNVYQDGVYIPIEGPPNLLKINGPHKGAAGEVLEYSFSAFDTLPSTEDNIYFYIEWGDGDVEEWIGPYDSGEEVILNHIYSSERNYMIRFKAKDSVGAESDWKEHGVSLPKGKIYNYPLIHRFLNNHPIIYQILQKFLK